MEATGHDIDAYNKNISEQYEALGRFVDAFEAMVDEVRQGCIGLLAADTQTAKWLAIPFYYQTMTAKPLWDIFRGVLAQMILDDDFGKLHEISASDQSVIMGVLTAIAPEYSKLGEIRNDLLHGTWFVGHDLDTEAREFELRRHKVTKTGLTTPLGLPRTAPELLTLGERCNVVARWINALSACLPTSPSILELHKTFRRVDGILICSYPFDSTLPAKP